MTEVNGATNTGRGFAERITSLGDSLIQRYRRYRIYRTTLAELRALSTRELQDLGIDRSMITRLAVEAAQGRK